MSGITMDASYRVSYANIWEMLLLQFLHPTSAKKFYVRYFTGIMFYLWYYADFIYMWNAECMNELPIMVQLAILCSSI